MTSVAGTGPENPLWHSSGGRKAAIGAIPVLCAELELKPADMRGVVSPVTYI